MKKSKFYLLTALVAFTAGTQANPLDDIYRLALENDPQLKADTAAYQAGQENRHLGRANLLPQLNGSASYTISESDTIYSLADGLPADGVKANAGSDVVEWGISLEQARSEER